MQISGNILFQGNMVIASAPDVVRSGLIAFLDPGNTASYSGSGTTITDLSGQGATGTINGTISYVNDGARSYFSFTSSNSNYISSSLSQGYVDCTIAFRPDFSINNGIVGLVATTPNNSSADKSLRFTGVTSPGPWQLMNPWGDSNDWTGTTATTWYLNGTASSSGTINLPNSWIILGGYKTGTGFPSTWRYHLGASGWPNRGFQGRLGAVLLYNRQLTAAEQRQNYDALRARYGL